MFPAPINPIVIAGEGYLAANFLLRRRDAD
jgi:hypothetical protein